MSGKAGYIVVLLALAILGAGVFYGLKGGNESGHGQDDGSSTANSDNNSSGFTIKNTTPGDSAIILEGESAQRFTTPFSPSAQEGGTPAGASNEKSCYVGPEKWNEKWKSGQVKEECVKGHPSASTPGFARYEFDVKNEGNYEVWLRAYWVDDCGNSVTVIFGDPESDEYQSRPLSVIGGTTYGSWTWNRLNNSELDAQKVRLKTGKNTLTICNREDDLYIDQILIRSADKKWPDPTGIAK